MTYAEKVRKVVAQRERGIITDNELEQKMVELTITFLNAYDQ